MVMSRKDRCAHINQDLSMCQSRALYAHSCNCKKHFADINCSTKASNVQMKRLKEIRKIIKQHSKIEQTIFQIKKEVGYGL